MRTHEQAAKFILQIADLLRGVYRPPQYERVMLPLTVLRRFDCVLVPTKPKVLAELARLTAAGQGTEVITKRLNAITGQRFHNRSPLDFEKLKGDPDNLAQHLISYIKGFSENVRTIFDYFNFEAEIEEMHRTNLLYMIVSRFCDVDLHPDTVDNIRMGLIFEELIRRFNEQANETAGDYFTPREVIRLMVNILFTEDDAILRERGKIRKLLDPACGTGGMLSEAQNYIREHHDSAHLYVYGQDYNKRAYAIAASDLLIKEQDGTGQAHSTIAYGDSFIEDKFQDHTFDYFLANPPFGVDWKRQQKVIATEYQRYGFAGRFGAGLPRISDGALLFLQHMVSKFEPYKPEERKDGSRLAIVFNGSPLFSGGAGSGESEIRKWIIENDWLEAIIALPEQMFYNTGINTYIWVVTNHKSKARKGKIQLIDARERYVPMRKSLGAKRRKLGEGKRFNPVTDQYDTDDPRDDIADIVKEHGAFVEGPTSKIFDNEDFGYTRVTVERPLRLRFQIHLLRKEMFLNAAPYLLDDLQAIDAALGREPQCDWNAVEKRISDVLASRGSKWKLNEWKVFRDVFTERDKNAEPVIKSKRGRLVEYEPDSELRDFENIPLKVPIDAYFATEVAPHVPDAWMDRSKDKIGYEINFNRYFYVYTPTRSIEEIDNELRDLETRIIDGLRALLETSQ
ncbi:MAG: N-6 DNA methylase [Capsulimonadaceae bacterium]